MTKPKKRPRGNPRGLAPTDAEIKRRAKDGYLTPAAVTKRFKLSPSTIYQWIRKGKVSAEKDGRNVWVVAASVEARRGGAP